MLHANMRANPSYETASEYFADAYGWELSKEMFSLLSQDQFICRVQTMHNVERGEQEETVLWLIYNRNRHMLMTFSIGDMQAIKTFLQAQDLSASKMAE